MVAPPGIPKIVVASSSFRYSSRSCATVSPDRSSPNCVSAGIPGAGAVGAACMALPPRECAYSIALRPEREATSRGAAADGTCDRLPQPRGPLGSFSQFLNHQADGMTSRTSAQLSAESHLPV